MTVRNIVSFRKLIRCAQFVQASLAIAAIVSAGAWFWVQGMYRPRIDVVQTIVDRQFTDKWVWLRAEIKITNNGLMKYDVPTGISRVSQLVPTPSGIRSQLKREELPRNQHGYFELPVLSEVRVAQQASVEPGETVSIGIEHLVHVQVRSVFVLAEFPSTASVKTVRSSGVVHDIGR